MGYEGWLIKIGTWQVPHKYIKPETYRVTPGKQNSMSGQTTTAGVMLYTICNLRQEFLLIQGK